MRWNKFTPVIFAYLLLGSFSAEQEIVWQYFSAGGGGGEGEAKLPPHMQRGKKKKEKKKNSLSVKVFYYLETGRWEGA